MSQCVSRQHNCYKSTRMDCVFLACLAVHWYMKDATAATNAGVLHEQARNEIQGMLALLCNPDLPQQYGRKRDINVQEAGCMSGIGFRERSPLYPLTCCKSSWKQLMLSLILHTQREFLKPMQGLN
eukprot:1140785-Pelagomonas_calceolata.AAC.1